MRRSYRLPALALALALAPSAALAQPTWDELPGSPFHSYRSEDISFVDAEAGWAVNGSGGVFRTMDSGDTWTPMANLEGYLRSTAFVSRDVGWIGVLRSQTAKLYETRDGGATFQNISDRIQPALSLDGGICSLFPISEQVVVGAGQYNGPARFIKTTDGGHTWASSSLAPLLDTVVDVHFFDEQRGLAVGGTGSFDTYQIHARVIGTEDGGATWTVRYTSTVPASWGWKLSFPTDDIGYMSIESYDSDNHAYVLKTTDGGASWQQLRIPNAGSGGDMQGIGFLTPEVGWVSGRNVVSRTVDGGATWTQIEHELDGQVNRFQFLDGGLGFASGRRIFRLDARPTAADPPADTDWGIAEVGPNPATDRVTVRYRLGAPGPVRVEVLDLLGRRVATLVDGAQPAGPAEATWDPGSTRASGLYVVRLQADGRQGSRLVTVVR